MDVVDGVVVTAVDEVAARTTVVDVAAEAERTSDPSEEQAASTTAASAPKRPRTACARVSRHSSSASS